MLITCLQAVRNWLLCNWTSFSLAVLPKRLIGILQEYDRNPSPRCFTAHFIMCQKSQKHHMEMLTQSKQQGCCFNTTGAQSRGCTLNKQMEQKISYPMEKNTLKMLRWFSLCGTRFNRGQWSGICFSVQTCWRTRLASLTGTSGFQPKKQKVFRQYCLRPSAHIARGKNRNMNTLTAEGQYDSFPDDGGYCDISQVSCLTPPLESWTIEWGIIQ